MSSRFKAGVRALDTITDLVEKRRGVQVNQFVVAGASKVTPTDQTLVK